jgi:LacI family repressor for deo operon, udp, cdd, tsx, nupC, and nupG
MPRSRVTIRDVAAHAGVSHQTVSRVINNSERVSPNTRARVEAAIEELGYQPDVIARSMAKGLTYTLGCISPNLTDYIFARMIECAQAEARRRGFFVLTGSAPTAADAQPLLDEMLNRRVDGLLVLNPRDDERYTYLLPLVEKGIPIVYLKNTPIDEAVSSVSCDDKQGGYDATCHLLALGHTAIATILGPENEECTIDRREGYHRALTEAGLDPASSLVGKGDWSVKSGGKAMQVMLASAEPFSAVFVQNDRMAMGAIRVLREAGRRVPQDVSIIGYDDIPFAPYIDPPLTTIQQPIDSFGHHGARLLIDTIRSRTPKPKHIRLNAQLIERQSCAPARA